jgi:DNA-binding beta-propeller fold protein YncE
MKTPWIALCLALALPAAFAEDKGRITYLEAEGFAQLPNGVRYPEGIAANPATGDIFTATFDFGPNSNKVVRFSANGKVTAVRDFGGTPLLGLGFAGNSVYILNFGASKLQRLPADFDASSPVQDVASFPTIGPTAPRPSGNPDGTSDTIVFAAGFPAPNGMVFDAAGNLYVSDSFQGAIYRIAQVATCPAPACPVEVVSHDPLLSTAGFPPFGANGLAFSADQKTLYIANTGDNRVLQMDVASRAVSVFAESVHGADGLWFENGRLWVAANQSDVVVALNASGRQVIRAGEFQGIRKDGTPDGLLFPASMTVVGGWMYVANLALPLTPMVGDEPEEDVRTWTISRFKLPN